jgi:hypothetical protein
MTYKPPLQHAVRDVPLDKVISKKIKPKGFGWVVASTPLSQRDGLAPSLEELSNPEESLNLEAHPSPERSRRAAG